MFGSLGVLGGIGAPAAQTATVPNTAGALFTLGRFLAATSVFSLLSGSNANLTIASATGIVSATVPIASGLSQVAYVREFNATTYQAVEYSLTLTCAGAVVIATLDFSQPVNSGLIAALRSF